MKHQRSPFPYLILAGVILIGLPILDYKVGSNHVLEYDIAPTRINLNKDGSDRQEDRLYTQTISHEVED